MTALIVADIGGTHARFADAVVNAGKVATLGAPFVFATAAHASLTDAWTAFLAQRDGAPPRLAAIAVAGPVRQDTIRFTNNPWAITPATLAAELGLDRVLLLNDFGAVAHAVAQADPSDLAPLCGPAGPLPPTGVVTVVGPGTGLGVAQVLRTADGYHAVETEGGHIGFAPFESFEEGIRAALAARHGRVSVERLVAGAGLRAIYRALGGSETEDDRAVWAAAVAGDDPQATAALDRYCGVLGAVTGDLALAHGAGAVVLAGGLAGRIAAQLKQGAFAARFAAKGRFAAHMRAIPVRLLTHPQPGLFGAAAAFAQGERG